MPVNHQLQEVGFLFSHILLPLFCKWIRIWLVSLFTVYLSRSISKHLKSNIGTEPKPDSHARKNSLVGQPPGLFPFLQPEYFLTLAKFLPPSKAKLKAKLLPLSKQNFSFSPSHILHGIPTTSLLPMLHFALFPGKEAANAEKVQS